MITSKRKKILRLNLTENLYTKNDKEFLKEIKDLNKLKDILCLQTGKLNIVKMAALPKGMHRVHAIPMKISMEIFPEID